MVICQPALTSNPVVINLSSRIGAAESLSREMQASFRQLEQKVSLAASQGLTPQQQAALVDRIVRQVRADLAESEARATRRVDRLGEQVHDWTARVVPLLADSARRGTVVAALSGATGDALARLDFGTADEMLSDTADHQWGCWSRTPWERLRSAREQLARAVAVRPFEDSSHVPALQLAIRN